jgi:hypothetical protein
MGLLVFVLSYLASMDEVVINIDWVCSIVERACEVMP